jgi:serine-type D-Ala-D-Ala carboxypeptidase (penicillin-binding protein 5/6)
MPVSQIRAGQLGSGRLGRPIVLNPAAAELGRVRIALIAWLVAQLFLTPALALGPTNAPAAVNFETAAAHAVLIDAATDTVLFQKAPDERMPPASMSKLMTVAVVFDAIRAGKLKLTDEFVVSENAWRQGGTKSGGSTMFAKLNSSISVDDLLHGIIIQSGNDACITMAEGMAGTEATFANMMNEEARHIGLTGSHFANSTGLPDPGQYMTAHDLARLAKYLIDEFPEFYKIFGEKEFTWNKIKQTNRNPLLEMNIGADGLKTGDTDEAGFGLVGSAVQGGQRLIMVVAGTRSAKERAAESRKLLEWGFRAFERVSLFSPGEVVGQARVFGGSTREVDLISKNPVDVLVPRGSLDQIKAQIVYQGPVRAPITSGQQIGLIRITAVNGLSKEAPLYAADDIPAGSMRQRALDAVQELVLGWW